MGEIRIHNKRGISGSTLKLIAMAAMFLDHMGAMILEPLLIRSSHSALLYDIDMLLRFFIGKMAFPIFGFLLVEGVCRTSDLYRYGCRILVFAVISEVIFDLAIYDTWVTWEHQNVMFTLLIGLGVAGLLRKITEVLNKPWLTFAACMAVLAAGMLLADVLHTDYGAYGVLCITVLYCFRRDGLRQVFAGTAAFVAGDYLINGSTAQMMAPIGLLIAYCYNGTRGMKLKYVFYAFYPIHLLLLCGIRMLLS